MDRQLIARRSTMMQPKGGGRLPAEYQEVEWLANKNATGAIPLTVYPSYSVGIRGIFGRGALNNMGTELVYSVNSSVNSSRWGVGTNGFSAVVGHWGTTYHSYNISRAYGKGDYVDFNFMNSHQLCFNDLLLASIPNQEVFSSHPFVSGGKYDNTGNLSYSDSIPPIHELILSDGSNIVSDLIACYRKSDHNAGFYDILNNEYLPSVGTGFEFGPDVN